MERLRNGVLQQLVDEHGFEVTQRTHGAPYQTIEAVRVDGLALVFSQDRGDYDRSMAVAPQGDERNMSVAEALRTFGLTSTNPDQDFLLFYRAWKRQAAN